MIGVLYVFFTVMSGFLIFMGLSTAFRPDSSPGLWIMIPTGGFILLVLNFGAYIRFLVIPRHTVREFRYDGSRLDYVVDPNEGKVSCDLEKIESVLDYSNRQTTIGYRIRLREGDWIWLTPETTHVEELVNNLRNDLKRLKNSG